LEKKVKTKQSSAKLKGWIDPEKPNRFVYRSASTHFSEPVVSVGGGEHSWVDQSAGREACRHARTDQALDP
jgi:hypothetical protein